MPPQLLILLHAAATWAMVGLIWFVQVVHYPLFARVGEPGFAAYEQHHTTRTTWVVAPLMLTELGTAVWLVLRPTGDPALAWAGLGLLAVVWTSTAALQVPCHRRLADGFDAGVAARLVRTNWIRTAAWTARGAIALRLCELAPSI